jgi:hypothetical protein
MLCHASDPNIFLKERMQVCARLIQLLTVSLVYVMAAPDKNAEVHRQCM